MISKIFVLKKILYNFYRYTARIWFVWVRFGLRKVNEPEIGLVSVCIHTVCFLETKLMDAVWPAYSILIAMGTGLSPKSEVQR